MFVFPLLEGGNAVRFFHFVFFVSGSVSFVVFCRSSFLRVVFWKNFRERTFVFGWLCWSCVFWWVFANVFALFFGVSLPKLFGKILFDVRSGFFWVRSLFLRFFFRRRRFSVFVLFFFFKRYRSGSHRTPPSHAPVFLVLFLFCVPPLLSFCPFWPCVPLLGVFPGCHSGPRAFLGFSLDLLRPFLGTRGGKGFRASCSCFVFLFPFCFAATPFLE